MGDLQLSARVSPDAVDIALAGALTAGTAPQVRTALTPHCSAVCRLRLSDCTDIDLDGLFALLAADIEAGEAGGQIRLIDVPPRLQRYLHQHHASHLLDQPEPPNRGRFFDSPSGSPRLDG
jgi:anti-anti-sigma regulatory factor